MVGKWYKGMPPVKAVLAHETHHPRPDGIKLGRITVSVKASETKSFTVEEVKCDPESYGEWIAYHPADHFQSYISIIRLKAVDNVIYLAVGFSGWLPLIDTQWVEVTSFFPVSDNGLPTDYLPLEERF